MVSKPRVQLNARGTLALTPAMRNSLAILKMPYPDLADTLVRAGEENPFLDVELPRGSATYGGFSPDFLESIASRPSLIERLAGQLGALRLEPQIRAALPALLGELREDGYLDCTLIEISEEQAIPVSDLEVALSALQGCEPVGIGARTLQEYLRIRLVDRGYSGTAAETLVEHLDLLARDAFGALSKKTGLDEGALRRAGALIRGFPPAPVENAAETVAYRVAELRTVEGPAGLGAELNPATIPVLRMNKSLAGRYAKAGGTTGTAAEYELDARRLIAALSARSRTLLRIGTHICRQQEEFFRSGASALVPMSRADAAEALGLHPSTLGRAVAGKAIEHAGRIIPLETFFSRALPRQSAPPVSAQAVQRAILEIVAGEPPAAPLSDDEICRRLNSDGVDIARRTVAKYRKWMRIPSSFERRRRKAQSQARTGFNERAKP